MRIDRMLGTFLGPHVVGTVHKARVAAVFAAVAALVRCGEIALSRLGRAIAVRTAAKHGIKRVDRLYGNGHLSTSGSSSTEASLMESFVTVPGPRSWWTGPRLEEGCGCWLQRPRAADGL
jgi:hypothetical protein